MESLRSAAFVVVGCLALFACVAAVSGAPPPEQLCGVCGTSESSLWPGIDGATDPGTLDVAVDSTGDSRWTARVPVNASAAERYGSNASALDAAVDAAWARYHVADGDVRDVESTITDGTVVVDYTVENVARRGVGGAWIVDYFAVESSHTRYRQAADRVTIHAPDGMTVTNRPPHATVEGAEATWTREQGPGTDGEFDERTYVTYGDTGGGVGGVLPTASGYATIGLEVWPPAIERGLVLGVVPGLLLGVVGLAVGRADVGTVAVDATRLERLVVGVGLGGAVGLLLAGGVSTARPFASGLGALSALGVGYALLGAAARRYGDRFDARGLVGLSGLATVVAGVTMWVLAGPYAPLVVLPFGLATALFLPIGYAFARGTRPVASLVAAALAPVIVVTLVSAGNPVSVLYVLLLVPWLVAVGAFGYPLALLGRRLASAEFEATVSKSEE